MADDVEVLFSYSELRKEMSDDEVEEKAAQELERLAKHIRDKKWPMIYHFTVEKQKDGPFTDVKLVLSYPWGG